MARVPSGDRQTTGAAAATGLSADPHKTTTVAATNVRSISVTPISGRSRLAVRPWMVQFADRQRLPTDTAGRSGFRRNRLPPPNRELSCKPRL
jgi:hypothetical protein